MNIWVIAPGEKAEIWDDCKQNKYIAIGWDKININKYSDKEDIKQDLIQQYNVNTDTRKHKFLWSFGKEIKKNDIVIARRGLKEVVGIGKITSDYINPDDQLNPRKNLDYKQIRYVKWLDINEHTIPSSQFQRDTIVKLTRKDNRIKDYIKEVILKENLHKINNLLTHQKQIILQGPPGTGKTRLAKQMARYIIKSKTDAKIDDLGDQVKLIQFHPSYSYEDFVRGIVAKSTDGKIEYKTEDKVLAQMAKKAKEDKSENKYILIIDEINRANLSSVLGELIYALEYRDEAVESMYDIDDGDRKITLPSNLYIIGTMNTADRSIGHIDYAIRRRFTFVDVLPDETIVNENSKFKEVEKMFDEPKYDGYLSPEFQKDKVMLGHSYFIADSDEELNNKLNYQVIPLLKEYVSDGVLLESANDEIKKLETDESTS